VFSFFTDDNSGVRKGVVCATLSQQATSDCSYTVHYSKLTKSVTWVAKDAKLRFAFVILSICGVAN
jgi:hypothetical protein